MDEKDLQMCQILFINSRTPIRDLADALDISVQGAHRRLKNLVSSGVIKKFTANISLSHLGVAQYCMGGKSDLKDIGEIIDVLATSDRTYGAIFSSGNFVFIQVFLKEMEDLEDYFDLIRNKALIKEPSVALSGRAKFGSSDFKLRAKGELKKIDIQMIKALHDNSRKTIAEVSMEIDAAQKTVKKRLDHIIEKNLVEFSMQWAPQASSGVTSVTQIKMKNSKDIETLQKWMIDRFGSRIFSAGNYLDRPEVLVFFTWSSTAMLHDELLSSLNSHEGIEWIKSHLTLRHHYFQTWRDDLLMEKAR